MRKDKRHKIVNEGLVSTLVIEDLSPSDAGKYSVVVDNMEMPFTLSVQALKPPVFTTKPKAVDTQEGEMLNIFLPQDARISN